MNTPMKLGDIMMRALRTEADTQNPPYDSYNEGNGNNGDSKYSENSGFILVPPVINAHETNVAGNDGCNCGQPHVWVVRDSLSKRISIEPLLMHTITHYGMCPRVLYASCKRLTIRRVVDRCEEIRKMHWLDNPGAYLRECLRNTI